MINERASKLRKQNLHVLQFLQESVAAKCQYHQVTSHAIRIAKKTLGYLGCTHHQGYYVVLSQNILILAILLCVLERGW